MPDRYDLRSARIVRDQESSDAEHAEKDSEARSRLGIAARLARQDMRDLVERLRAPRTILFGEPCKPFHPQIHLDAAAAIEGLEHGDTELTNEEVLDLCIRLMGFYGLGPGGAPLLGYQIYPVEEITLEAAGRICLLAPDLAAQLGVSVGGKPEQAASP